MSLVHPLKIGSLTLPSNLIQGPLAGVSCGAFRRLAWRYSTGALGLCLTEMLMSYGLAHDESQAERYVWRAPEERFLSAQLSGSKPEILVAAALRVQHYHPLDMFDINCGCPVKKIRRKNQGSRLLADPELLKTMVKALKSELDVPISVKIRVDGHSQDQFNPAVLEAVVEGGADCLTVHGRHWQEDYSVACHHDQIAELVAASPIPLIANGDVADTASCRQLFEQTGCAGVMIARAGVGQPWLFAQIRAELSGEIFAPPALVERGEIFLAHLRDLVELDGERNAVLQARGLAKYYVRGAFDAGDFLKSLNQLDQYQAVEDLVKQYFR